MVEKERPGIRATLLRPLQVSWFGARRLVEIVGVISLVMWPLQIRQQILMPPSIHVHSGQVDDPFSLRVVVSNPGWFGMSDMTTECFIISVDAAVPGGAKIVGRNNLVGTAGNVKSLKPGALMQINCSFFGQIYPHPVASSVRMTVSIWYKRFGVDQYASSEVFNWDAISREWTEGQMAN